MEFYVGVQSIIVPWFQFLRRWLLGVTKASNSYTNLQKGHISELNVSPPSFCFFFFFSFYHFHTLGLGFRCWCVLYWCTCFLVFMITKVYFIVTVIIIIIFFLSTYLIYWFYIFIFFKHSCLAMCIGCAWCSMIIFLMLYMARWLPLIFQHIFSIPSQDFKDNEGFLFL